MKISVALFAFAALLQLSHSIPPHRFARDTRKGILEQIVTAIGGIVRNEVSQSESQGESPVSESESQGETPASESESAAVKRISSSPVLAASELHSSVVTKEGVLPHRFARETQRGIVEQFVEFLESILDNESESESESQGESPASESESAGVNRISSSPVLEGTHVTASEQHSSVITKEGIPPHRFARETRKGVLGQIVTAIGGIVRNEVSQSESQGESPVSESESQGETTAPESESAAVKQISSSPVLEGTRVAASEQHPSVVAKEGIPAHRFSRETQRGIVEQFVEFLESILDNESESESDSQGESTASESESAEVN